MIRVGVTGGIGSGKTLVCKVFEKLGISVFYADEEAKELLNTDTNIRKALINHFGSEMYDENGIRKSALAAKIFNDPDALRWVNNLVHPAVRQVFLSWSNGKKNLCTYVIEEAAILFESGAYKDLDFNILVYAPESMRINRVLERDQVERDQVIARMRRQWNDEDKLGMADAVIYNDESRLVLPQILDIHQQLIKKK